MKSDPRLWVQDASGFGAQAEGIFSPGSEEELANLLRNTRVPVTIAGAGTGVAGGSVPSGGGIVISLDRFRKLEISEGYAVAGAGVPLADLHLAASRSRQFYPPDPTEITASVGGTIATSASGSRSFRYGDTRRHVLRLRVVLMDGTILELFRGQPVPFDVGPVRLPATTKHSAGLRLQPGMDYMDLFIGSEGILGVITEATVGLLPAPGELLSGVVFFRSTEEALDAVEAWRPVPGLRMLEYMDARSLDLLRPRYSEIPQAARAALLMEQEEADADRWADRVIDAGAMADESWFGLSSGDRERFRAFRHALPEAVNDTVRRRGVLKMGTDFAVPTNRNREMLRIYGQRLEGEQYVIFGHIGDAHLHVNLLPETEADAARARDLITELAREAVALGGTVAAEHGLGKRKAHLLAIQFTSKEIEHMREVKRRLDPQWWLGRGTLLPISA